MGPDVRTNLADGVLEDCDGQQVIRFQRHLPHSIERVWAALTEPGQLIGWWGDAEVNLVEGGQFILRWLNTDDRGDAVTMRATIVSLVPPTLLETRGEPHGVLRWELRPDATGTLLTFSSTLALPDVYWTSVLAGWHYHLEALAATLLGRSMDLVHLPNATWEQLRVEYAERLA